ncbi:MAG TPA: ABC transporter [Myxococcales bacterium]|nr:ABC transporter [Myxococcales bacterium]
MPKVLAIARREIKSYFDSPIAYIVVTAFLLVAGWMFFSALFLMERADLRGLFHPSPFSPSMLLVILAPAVTMRLVSEERKSGTFELLTTMPVTDWQVVLGKFLAGFALIATALGLTLAYAFTVSGIGDLDWGPVVSGYLGTLLFSATLLAIGLLCSTLTDNQIVAFIVGFIVCAALYFVYWLQFFLPSSIAPLVEFISTSSHLENMARGVVDSRDVLYYLSLTGGALFLAERALSRQHA